MSHLVATLIYLSQIYSYYIRGVMSPFIQDVSTYVCTVITLGDILRCMALSGDTGAFYQQYSEAKHFVNL